MTDTLAAELKARIAKLESTIVNPEIRAYLLQLPNNLLGDAQHISPQMFLLIDQHLKNVEDAVAKYGPTIRLGP